MKIIPVLALLGLIALLVYFMKKERTEGSSCCGTPETKEARVRVADRNKSHYPYTYLLSIDGMMCDNCAARVENALNRCEGTWAKVDLSEKEALVRPKERREKEDFSEALKGTSYTLLKVSEV